MSKKTTAKRIAERIPRPKKKVTWPQARAFSVHLLTASGSFLAFLSLVAASEQRWTAMFWWLGLALFVDGIDGPIARKLEVKEILPTWSGELLDNIIDYVTYVLIPAFALYQRGFMGEKLSFLAAAIIVVSSAIYYADTGMKTKENFFKGFPVVWNMVVFTLFVIEPGQWVSFGVVVAAGILTFLPINFIHPVRVVRLRPINLTVTLLWCAFGALALAQAALAAFIAGHGAVHIRSTYAPEHIEGAAMVFAASGDAALDPHFGRHPRYVRAVEHHLAAARHQAGDRSDGRGFAGAVGPQQRNKLPCRDRQVETVHGPHGAVVDSQSFQPQQGAHRPTATRG